jgi:hypothetical protein
VLYGGGNSNPSKESYFMLPDGREKPVLMTLQALKHEEVRPPAPPLHTPRAPALTHHRTPHDAHTAHRTCRRSSW